MGPPPPTEPAAAPPPAAASCPPPEALRAARTARPPSRLRVRAIRLRRARELVGEQRAADDDERPTDSSRPPAGHHRDTCEAGRGQPHLSQNSSTHRRTVAPCARLVDRDRTPSGCVAVPMSAVDRPPRKAVAATAGSAPWLLLPARL